MLIIAAIAVIAAFVLLRPKADPVETTPSPSSISTPIDTSSPSVSETFSYADGAVEGPPIVHATQGDVVELIFASDVDGEAHLHSYEVMGDVTAGESVTLTVTADTAGRFPLEFHGEENAHAEVTVLEVTP